MTTAALVFLWLCAGVWGTVLMRQTPELCPSQKVPVVLLPLCLVIGGQLVLFEAFRVLFCDLASRFGKWLLRWKV